MNLEPRLAERKVAGLQLSSGVSEGRNLSRTERQFILSVTKRN